MRVSVFVFEVPVYKVCLCVKCVFVCELCPVCQCIYVLRVFMC